MWDAIHKLVRPGKSELVAPLKTAFQLAVEQHIEETEPVLTKLLSEKARKDAKYKARASSLVYGQRTIADFKKRNEGVGLSTVILLDLFQQKSNKGLIAPEELEEMIVEYNERADQNNLPIITLGNGFNEPTTGTQVVPIQPIQLIDGKALHLFNPNLKFEIQIPQTTLQHPLKAIIEIAHELATVHELNSPLTTVNYQNQRYAPVTEGFPAAAAVNLSRRLVEGNPDNLIANKDLLAATSTQLGLYNWVTFGKVVAKQNYF